MIKRCKLEMCPELRNITYTKQQGIGLPVALFVITVLALIVVALTDLEESSGISFSLDINSMRAFYAAESGAQVALAEVFPAGGSVGTCASISPSVISFNASGLNGCQATVGCSVATDSGISYFSLQSTGSCGSGADRAERVIVVRARP